MKRFLLFGLLVVLTPLSAEAPDGFGAKLARFHEHYNLFMRAYLGCSKAAVSIDDCKPNLGIFDFREFRHAKEDAAPLFDLTKKD